MVAARRWFGPVAALGFLTAIAGCASDPQVGGWNGDAGAAMRCAAPYTIDGAFTGWPETPDCVEWESAPAPGPALDLYIEEDGSQLFFNLDIHAAEEALFADDYIECRITVGDEADDWTIRVYGNQARIIHHNGALYTPVLPLAYGFHRSPNHQRPHRIVELALPYALGEGTVDCGTLAGGPTSWSFVVTDAGVTACPGHNVDGAFTGWPESEDCPEWSDAPATGSTMDLHVEHDDKRVYFNVDVFVAQWDLSPADFVQCLITTKDGAAQWLVRIYGDQSTIVEHDGLPYVGELPAAYGFHASPPHSPVHQIVEIALPYSEGAGTLSCGHTPGDPEVFGFDLTSEGVDLDVVDVPVLLAISPPFGNAGDSVVLHGGYFGDAVGEVLFGAQPALVTDWKDDRIEVIVPEISGPTWVSMISASGKESNGLRFGYACAPTCVDKACGPDGCGGTCGTCPSGQACQIGGQCACEPTCDGAVCGPNGCGGTCGACPWGTACSADGVCECSSDCGTKVCGPDGCGGTCGSCGSGVCVAGHCCVPDCGGAVCGSDGCGGSCGTCELSRSSLGAAHVDHLGVEGLGLVGRARRPSPR